MKSEALAMDVTALVEPDRVHRTVYTDQQIFDAEMEKIWERIWIYCGHVSQVPNPGDYYAVTIGRQPMLMVRQNDGGVQVLYNLSLIHISEPTRLLSISYAVFCLK